MVQRPVAMSNPAARAGNERADEIGLGVFYRLLQRKPAREPGRDRRRQGAADAVTVGCRHP